MKQISYWARSHKTAARIILILLYIPLNIAGLLTGYLLQETGVSFTANFIYTLIILVLAVYFFYPAKATYYKRKIFEGVMITCTYLMICFYGNQLNNPAPVFPFSSSTQAVSYTINHRGIQPVSNDPGKTLTKKELRKELKQSFRQKKEMKKGWKIALIILTILVAAGLIYVFLALGCAIACSGSEALAIVVVLLGSAATIFGAIKLIQYISGKKRRKEK